MARGPAVIPAPVLDPDAGDVEAQPDQVHAIYCDLRHGRGSLRHEEGGAGKGHGHPPRAADRGSRGAIPADAALQSRLAAGVAGGPALPHKASARRAKKKTARRSLQV